jgi:hypothetical protein
MLSDIKKDDKVNQAKGFWSQPQFSLEERNPKPPPQGKSGSCHDRIGQ